MGHGRIAAVVGAVFACVVTPGSAFASTLGNGVYTAGPNEGNVIQVTYEPDTDSYRFRAAATTTDTDGPGGCSVEGYVASCPGSAISKIVINDSDGRDFVSVGTNGFVPPLGLSEANQVRIPVEIHGNGGNDVISGGWGTDLIDGGPGSDLINGAEGSYLNSTPESQIQARDVITCGTGEDVGGNGFTFEDTATMGPGDAVEADCEAVQQMVNCPRNGPDCSGVAPVEAIVPGNGGAASAAGKRSSRRRIVVLGSHKFKLQSGQSEPVTTRLKPKRVRRVLRTGKSVRAISSALARKHGRSKLLERTRFRLTKSS